MKPLLIAATLTVGTVGGAHAQGFTYVDQGQIGFPAGNNPLQGQPVNPATTYLDSVAPLPGVTDINGQQTYGRQFVRLSDVLAAAGGTGGTGGEMGFALAAIAGRLDRINARLSEGIALAGAINVLPPEPGRKLNISVGGAGYNGAAAASIAVSARINETTIGYVGVAQGPTQTLVKGGFGWSPW